MRFKKKHNSNEDTFWLSATDMMAGILTVVLLLLMLFVLYLNQSKDEVFTPLDATQHYGHNDQETIRIPYQTEHGDRYLETTGREGGEEHTEPPTEAATEPNRPHDGDEEGTDKAAVFVTVVDADTENTIKQSGIEFELYTEKNGSGGLQTLYTYYPEKIEYKKYETTDLGTFYLPEKITDGWYSLHNTVAPNGYYAGSYTDFEVDEYRDWPEPYMVKVYLVPIKNTIRITVQDAETKKPLEGVEYEIVASEDIESSDGTVRYAEGKVVDTLTSDQEGSAESKELYLGKYHLRQISAPEYYAVSNVPVGAEVGEESDSAEDGLITLKCSRTSVTVQLTDEHTGEPIPGAVYTMEGREEAFETDAQGRFVVTDLKKQSSNTLTLQSLPDGYRSNTDEITFIVDSSGLVNDEPAAVIEETAYTLSISVQTKDKVFGRTTLGVDLELLDENEELVDTWTSNKDPYIVSGLSEGTYYLQKLGDKESRIKIEVKDSAKIQTANMYLWDTIDLFALLMAVGTVILAVLIAALMINRRRKAKRNHE